MEKLSVIKLLVKDHHDNKEDLVSRPLVRAFNKIKTESIKNFIDNNGVYLYCYQEDDKVYEVFTQREIDLEGVNYQEVSSQELLDNVKSLSQQEIGKIYALIGKLVLGDNVAVDFIDISTPEELASDRAVLFKEYNQGLSLINPYERNHENDYNKSLVERMMVEKEIIKKQEETKRRR